MRRLQARCQQGSHIRVLTHPPQQRNLPASADLDVIYKYRWAWWTLACTGTHSECRGCWLYGLLATDELLLGMEPW